MKKSMLLVMLLALPVSTSVNSAGNNFKKDAENNLYAETAAGRIGGENSKISLDEVNGKTKATFGLSFDSDKLAKGLSFEFKLTAPFDKNDPVDTELLTFDGLANASTFTVSMNYDFCQDEQKEHCKLGLDYSIGNESFDYVDASDISTKHSENQSPRSLKISYANYLSKTLLLEFKYANQTFFDAGKKKNLCFQYAENITECADFTVGSPTKRTEELAEAKVRVETSLNRSLVALKVTHNFDESASRVEIPFYNKYELNEKDAALYKITSVGGGLKLSWDSLSREIRFGIFVSSTL